MTNYGEEFEENHESMHMHRRERHYNGHKLAVAVGHNKAMRAKDGESTKRKHKKV
jgi:hypothetical protein